MPLPSAAGGHPIRDHRAERRVLAEAERVERFVEDDDLGERGVTKLMLRELRTDADGAAAGTLTFRVLSPDVSSATT
jgi:hypothetical protein